MKRSIRQTQPPYCGDYLAHYLILLQVCVYSMHINTTCTNIKYTWYR